MDRLVAPEGDGAEHNDFLVPRKLVDPAFQCAERDDPGAGDAHFLVLPDRADIQQHDILFGIHLLFDLARGNSLEVSGQLVFHDIGRGDDVVHGRGVGRGIAEVQAGDLLNGHAGQDGGRGHVYPLVTLPGADALRAEKPVGLPVGHELQHDHSGAGHEVLPVRRRGQHADGIKAGLARGVFREAGAGHAEIKDLADGASEDAGEFILSAADVHSGGAALLVGGGAEREIGGPAGDHVRGFDAVSGGIDAGIGSLHPAADPDCAGGTEFEPCFARKVHVGPDAHGQEDHVGGNGAFARVHLLHPALAPEGLHKGAGQHPDAVGFQMVIHGPRHFPVQDVQNLGLLFRDGHTASARDQRFGHFNSQQSAADNHDIAGLAGRKQVPDALRIAHAVKREDVGQVGTRNRRDAGRGAGGENQRVIGDIRFAAAGQIRDFNGLFIAVNAGGFSLAEDGDPLDILEENRIAHHAQRTGHELFLLLDDAGKIVGQAAARIRKERAALDDGHLRHGIQPYDLGSHLGAGGNSADDHHFPFSVFRGGFGRGFFLLVHAREIQQEGGSAEFRLIHADGSPGRFDQRLHKGQSEPDPRHGGVARGTGAIEGSKKILAVFVGYSDAGVLDRQPEKVRVILPGGNAEHDLAVFGGVLQRIAHEGLDAFGQRSFADADERPVGMG